MSYLPQVNLLAPLHSMATKIAHVESFLKRAHILDVTLGIVFIIVVLAVLHYTGILRIPSRMIGYPPRSGEFETEAPLLADSDCLNIRPSGEVPANVATAV
jgi:hypothetical protein